MPRVLIIIQGGLVESVYSDMQGLDIRLLDMDIIEDGDEKTYHDFIIDNLDLVSDESVDETKIRKQYPHSNY